MRTILLSILVFCLVSCEQARNTAASTKNASFLSDTEADSVNMLAASKQPTKTAKKRNCSSKQTFEGARGGIYHLDTAKNGNVYKHYVKQ